MMQGSVLRRSPLLLLATALVALASVFALPPSPASAEPNHYGLRGAVGYEGGNAVLNIYLSRSVGSGVTFTVTTNLAFNASTAHTNDVGAVPATVTAYSDNPSNNTLTIPITDNSWAEDDESFTVTITTIAAGWSPISTGANTAIVGIPGQIWIPNNAIAEEGQTAEAEVLLASPAPTGGLAFTITTNLASDASTASTADVGTLPTSLTILAGERKGTLSFPIIDDELHEPSESFQVYLSTSATGGWHEGDNYPSGLAVVIAPSDGPVATDRATTVWSATLTPRDVGSIYPGGYGCQSAINAATCLEADEVDTSAGYFGALTEDEFTYAGVGRQIIEIHADGISLRIGLSGGDTFPANFTLYSDGTAFPSSQATLSDLGATAEWSTSLDWSGGSAVQLSLTVPPPPSGVKLSTETLAITEGASGAFTVALTDDPGSSATVTLARTQYFQPDVGQTGHDWNLNAATVSPATLTFTAGTSGNYATPQTVTVTGADDADCISEQLVILVLVGGSGSPVEGVFVTIADDETCGGL